MDAMVLFRPKIIPYMYSIHELLSNVITFFFFFLFFKFFPPHTYKLRDEEKEEITATFLTRIFYTHFLVDDRK